MNCPLFTTKPLSTVRVANVEVKVVQNFDGQYFAGVIAHLPDYMELLDWGEWNNRKSANEWANAKVKELFNACGHTHIPKMQVAV